MDVKQNIHAETSIVRSEKTPTETSQVRIQKTSAETSIDKRQNIHAETSFVRTEKTPAETSIYSFVNCTVATYFHRHLVFSHKTCEINGTPDVIGFP